MNVKFKMPKFGRKLTGSSMLRELLLTTLATTISIVLTFGTAAFLEHKQQEKNRRQITLMVISDIYDFARVMERADTAYLIPVASKAGMMTRNSAIPTTGS